MLPAMGVTGASLWAQTSPMSPAQSAVQPATDKAQAEEYLKEGRRCLQNGDAATAQRYGLAAKQYKGNWEFWREDTPEKLLGDIAAQTGAARSGAANPTGSGAGDAPALSPIGSKPEAAHDQVNLPSDAHELVKAGREYLKHGNIDLAEECAHRALKLNAHWGLFEYNAEKLMSQVKSAKSERDRVEAEKLLAEAKRLYQRGDLDMASELARKAERLHGPYGMWDMSDRPAKLIAEIDAAKARQRRSAPATQPTSQIAANQHADYAQATTARSQLTETQFTDTPTPQGQILPPPPPPVPQRLPSAAANSQAPVGSPTRMKALALMTECRALQRANKLADARAKALEAQRLGADYAAGDDRPETALTDIAQTAASQINSWVDQAMRNAGNTPTKAQAAQANEMLAQAREFAMRMGFDTIGIDEKIKWLNTASGATAPSTGIAHGNDQHAQGRDMLVKANLELRNGQTESARRLAEAVFSGPYGLQSEASALLRNIEVEEHNQHVLRANQAYDAGCAAMNRGDHQHAISIFMSIDGTLLSADKCRSMNECMQKCNAAVARTSAPAGVQRVAMAETPLAPPPDQSGSIPGHARAGDPSASRTVLPATPIDAPMPAASGPDSYAGQVRALQQVEFQRLRAEGMKVQREAQLRFSRGETDSAIQLLQDFLRKIKDAQLDSTDLALLQRPIEYRMQTFKVLKGQRDAETQFASANTKKADKLASERAEADTKYKQVKELMKQYNQLMDEKKYADAEVLAMKAQDLDPDSDVVGTAVHIAKMAKRVAEAERLKSGKEEIVYGLLKDTDKEGKPLTIDNPIDINQERLRNASARGPGHRETGRLHTERELEIQRKLSTPVTVDFNNTSARDTVKWLHDYLKMNIVMDSPEMLKADGINPDAPISLKVEAVPLKSVLNLILKQARMTYIISDDVLQVVSEKKAQGRLKQVIYPVADLVVPIDSYTVPNTMSLEKMLAKSVERQTRPEGMKTTGTSSSLPNGQPAIQTTMSTTGGANPMPLSAHSQEQTSVSLAKNTIEDVLIKLITNTVAPNSWSDVGGAGQIQYYPLGMAMVVNQFEDIQEQIADLLDQLRKLQDLEVAIEVRIVSVSESFFERMGMDFSMNISTNSTTKNFQPQLVTGQFGPAGFLNSPFPTGVIAGTTPAGTFTPDLAVPITNNSFNMAIPPFGGYPNSPGANGGLSLGLAFLNDIQVFMFMEAAQGDRRVNVMQAPKLTAFNGANATISITDMQFFVTDLQVFNVNGQIIFNPVNTPFPIGGGTTNGQGNTNSPGITLSIQPAVSADRRYVRMNMTVALGSLASATVPLFPVTAFITPTFEGGFIGQPIPFTQFIQQPAFSSMLVNTTVSVPDGSTVVLGGLKTLNEGRNEFGPPILSKIPYINRLFRNTAYGRDAQSMMLMVTPRIIINREEAERQVGEGQDDNVPGVNR